MFCSSAALITAILELFRKCIIMGPAFIFCGSSFFRVPEMMTQDILFSLPDIQQWQRTKALIQGWSQSWPCKGESSSKDSKEFDRPFETSNAE
ncbi:uncharacterized protein PRD47_013934 isoform 2-T2 [Ara ararauna]